jgi:hypothetical protein
MPYGTSGTSGLIENGRRRAAETNQVVTENKDQEARVNV